MCGFLVSSYVFFYSQARELQLLQEHYQEHVDVLKRVIADVLVNGGAKSVPGAADRTQLHQSLRSYLQQKETNIDVHDLQELYRSFDQPVELKREAQEVLVPSPHHGLSHTRVAHKRVMSKKKPVAKKRLFSWPIERHRVWLSSFFGRRRITRGKWSFHKGLDMATARGTPVRAAADGKVMEAGDSGNGFGNTIMLAHMQGYKTRYAHLDRVRVHSGQSVHRGQVIGTVGATGNVRANGTDASHLHFEVHCYDKPVNPLYHLS